MNCLGEKMDNNFNTENTSDILEEKVETKIETTAEGSLPAYLRQMRKFPMLEAKEEYRLAKLWQKSLDEEAAATLVSSHLRLVAKIAAGYRGYGFPFNELISEGTVGAMEGLKRFDPDKGARFSTYVSWWIHASLKEYVLRHWSLVRMGTTAAQKKLFFGLRRIKEKLEQSEVKLSHAETVAKIAEALAVPETVVIEMEQRLSGPDYSLNAPMSAGQGGEWQDWLEDEVENQEELLIVAQEWAKRRELLDYAMEHLNNREQKILTERHLREPPMTLSEIAQNFGLSRERIRQIEIRSLDKISQIIKRRAAEMRL